MPSIMMLKVALKWRMPNLRLHVGCTDVVVMLFHTDRGVYPSFCLVLRGTIEPRGTVTSHGQQHHCSDNSSSSRQQQQRQQQQQTAKTASE